MKKSILSFLILSILALVGVLYWKTRTCSNIHMAAQMQMEAITNEHMKCLAEIENVRDNWEELKSNIEREFLQRRKAIENSANAEVMAAERSLRSTINQLRELRPDFKEFHVNTYIPHESSGLAGYTIRWDSQSNSPEIEFDFKGAQKNVTANVELFDRYGLFLGHAECELKAGSRLMWKKAGWLLADIAVKFVEALAQNQAQAAHMHQDTAKDISTRQQMMAREQRWQKLATATSASKEIVHDKAMKEISDRNDSINEKVMKGIETAFIEGVPKYYTLTVRSK